MEEDRWSLGVTKANYPISPFIWHWSHHRAKILQDAWYLVRGQVLSWNVSYECNSCESDCMLHSVTACGEDNHWAGPGTAWSSARSTPASVEGSSWWVAWHRQVGTFLYSLVSSWQVNLLSIGGLFSTVRICSQSRNRGPCCEGKVTFKHTWVQNGAGFHTSYCTILDPLCTVPVDHNIIENPIHSYMYTV